VISGLAALAIFLVYAGGFGFALVIAPARLALVGGAPGLDSLTKPTGNMAFVWDLARWGFEHLTLPWLSRHPRVRHAWSRLYIDGKSKLDDLGKAARTSFLTEPEILDAWVSRSALRAENSLRQLDLFKQRQIYVPFPIRKGENDALIERPSAEAFREIFLRDRTIVSIIGSGGTGKSTLACALARWAFASDPNERLAAHRMLPVFVVQDTTNLTETVTQELRRMLGEEELPNDLVRGLMAKRRLLVIVDALSERQPETQRHIEQIFTQDLPLNAVVVTARAEPNLGPLDRSVLHPVKLDAGNIVPFIIGYMARMKAAPELQDGRVQLKLGERILTLAESGGQKTPVTPLLVTLFVDSALRRAAGELSFGDMPEAVPEIFVDYLRRLNSSQARPDGPFSDDQFIRAAQTIASVSLGKDLIPQDFLPQDATEALKQCGFNDQESSSLLNRLVASGVLERRRPGGVAVLRFNLDPAAEYLAAIRRLFGMRTAGREEWHTYLSSLEQTVDYPKGPEGFVIALATSYRAYKKDLNLPQVTFPWEGAPLLGAPDFSIVPNALRRPTKKRLKRSPRP
jgi:hypothetical protein